MIIALLRPLSQPKPYPPARQLHTKWQARAQFSFSGFEVELCPEISFSATDGIRCRWTV